MSWTTKFPRTNLELAELGGGQPMRFSATEEEYWALASEAEYRVDFVNGEIIASMSYESDEHSALASRLNYLLQTVFEGDPSVRIHTVNRPICIPECDYAIFNPDGSAVRTPGEKYEYRPGMTAELTPVLLFEVLSGTTRLRDWGEKLPCYKRIPSLQQILYLESDLMRMVVLDRLPDSGKWLESTYEQPEDSFSLGSRTVRVADVYAGIPLDRPTG